MFSAACVAFVTGVTVAVAQDAALNSQDGAVSLSGGVGLGFVSASEFVYNGGFKNSQLDYRSKAITIYSVDLAVQLPHEFKLRVGGAIGAGGSGSVTDYDWVAPFYADTSKDGWSDRSISDTKLGHYWDASIEIGHDLYSANGFALEGLGGFKYTDVKWNAHGGSYIYSSASPRDDVGDLPDGVKPLSYRQKVPVAYLGLNASQTVGKFSVSGGLNGGVSFGINDVDNHWLTNTLYHEDMNAAPVVLASLGASYAVTPKASLFLSGSFERVFRARGDSRSVDTVTGERNSEKDNAGALFQSLLIKVGIKATF